MSDLKTAGIIIIGNEILSGKVRDVNSYYLVRELRSLGVDVRQISVIPDDIGIIGSEAVDFSERFDHVFTSGGVGPTHDDVTMEGIAKGFKVRLITHNKIKDFLMSRYNDRVNRSILKMAEVPEGAEMIFNSEMRFPVVSFRNIFIFPGIPEYLTTKFALIRERFRTAAFHLRKIYINAHESQFAEALNIVVADNPDVSFGSYPVKENGEYMVFVTAESKSETLLEKAVNDLVKRLPNGLIVRIEKCE